MPKKKCIICGAEAKFCIKGTSNCYCQECAEENFSDISVLVKVEDEAATVKRMVDDTLEDGDDKPVQADEFSQEEGDNDTFSDDEDKEE